MVSLDGSATSIAFGDVLSAAADVDSVMIGTSGKFDIFEINAPTAAGSGSTNSQIANEVQEVWIYGMSNQSGTVFDKDEIVIKKLDSSTALTSPLSGTTGTIEAGITYNVESHTWQMEIISLKWSLPLMVVRLEMLMIISLSYILKIWATSTARHC